MWYHNLKLHFSNSHLHPLHDKLLCIIFQITRATWTPAWGLDPRFGLICLPGEQTFSFCHCMAPLLNKSGHQMLQAVVSAQTFCCAAFWDAKEQTQLPTVSWRPDVPRRGAAQRQNGELWSEQTTFLSGSSCNFGWHWTTPNRGGQPFYFRTPRTLKIVEEREFQ